MTSSTERRGPAESTAVARCMAYAESVLSGRQKACRKVKMACRRFMDDLEKSRTDPDYPWIFDERKAARPGDFMEHFLTPTKGDYDRMVLMDWQEFIECNIYGWVDRETGYRRFRRR